MVFGNNLKISNNLTVVKDKMAQAAARVGRNPQDIKLLAVTKTVGMKEIQELLQLGQTDLAENRVQDALRKQETLRERLPSQTYGMHLIGSLQRKKVPMVIGRFDLIHSVDSWRLAVEIDTRAGQAGVKVPVLIQVNVSGESSKHGLEKETVEDFYKEAATLKHLEICGLMTMAPLVPDPEETRPVFRGLYRLFQKIKEAYKPDSSWRHLSMGMSNDYEVAIEEGATIIRVGSAIFNSPEED